MSNQDSGVGRCPWPSWPRSCRSPPAPRRPKPRRRRRRASRRWPRRRRSAQGHGDRAVQAVGRRERKAAKLVRAHGGKVTSRVPLIHGLAVKLPAKQAKALARRAPASSGSRSTPASTAPASTDEPAGHALPEDHPRRQALAARHHGQRRRRRGHRHRHRRRHAGLQGAPAVARRRQRRHLAGRHDRRRRLRPRHARRGHHRRQLAQPPRRRPVPRQVHRHGARRRT